MLLPLFSLLLSLLTPPSQVKVRPGDDLQAALDAAAPGALVMVIGEHGPIHVRKPVALIGRNGGAVRHAPLGCCTWQSPIILDGPGAGTVTLSGLEIGFGSFDAHQFGTATPAIAGSGFTELVLERCKVEPGRPFTADSLVPGASALDLEGGPCVVRLQDSSLRASDVFPWDPLYFDGPTGAPAVRAPAAHVFALRSAIVGGGVQNLSMSWACGYADTYGGNGGPGLYAATVRVLASRARGGAGASWYDTNGALCRTADQGPAWVETTGGAR